MAQSAPEFVVRVMICYDGENVIEGWVQEVRK